MSLLTMLLIAWATIAGVLVLLLIYRGVLGMHEDEGLYLSAGEQQFARDTADSVARQTQLSPWIRWAGAATGALAAVIAGVWVYQSWSLFF